MHICPSKLNRTETELGPLLAPLGRIKAAVLGWSVANNNISCQSAAVKRNLALDATGIIVGKIVDLQSTLYIWV